MFSRAANRCSVIHLSLTILLASAIARADGQRPAMQRMPMQGESLTTLRTGSGGAVAQTGVPAAIYRSSGCGFQSWIGGIPSWLDQIVLYNDGGAGAALRTVSSQACFDTCHRGGRCVGQGGAEDCDCLAPEDIPFDVTLQMYDGDPCGGGVPIAGAGGTITIDETLIDPATDLGDGNSHCFNLEVVVDPKVTIPHESWIEMILGVDDGWALIGHPNSIFGQGESNLSGLNDGVDCSTFCDIGDPGLCSNDPDRCDWMLASLDSNAELLFSLRPVPPPEGSKFSATTTYSVVDNEAILPKGGEPVFFEVMVSDWDPGGVGGVRVDAWASQVDSAGYSSGLRGTLSPIHEPCLSDADCAPNLGPTSHCINFVVEKRCAPAFINPNRSDYIFFGLNELLACDLGTADFRCASTVLFGGFAESPGRDSYLWTLFLHVPEAAKGTFTIDLRLPPASALVDINDQFLPWVGVVPGKVTVETGACCELSGGPGNEICVEEDSTANECAAAGGAWAAGVTCDNCDLLCLTDDECDDGDACTVDQCVDNLCTHEPVTLEPDACCDSSTGIASRDDGNPCTVDSCSGGGQDGVPVHIPAAAGTACDDGDDCTVSDACNEQAVCTGEPNPACAAVPAVSAWGGVIMTLLLLVGARVYYRRHGGETAI